MKYLAIRMIFPTFERKAGLPAVDKFPLPNDCMKWYDIVLTALKQMPFWTGSFILPQE